MFGREVQNPISVVAMSKLKKNFDNPPTLLID
jgi:hypothetical protein